MPVVLSEEEGEEMSSCAHLLHWWLPPPLLREEQQHPAHSPRSHSGRWAAGLSHLRCSSWATSSQVS